MIEVFKTNVHEASEAKKIASLLLQHFPGSRINFDLHDCDKILRVEGKDFVTEEIMVLVKEEGYACHVLE